MVETKTTEAAEKQAAIISKRAATAELKAKAKAEAQKTKAALTPLRNRTQTLIREYENCASIEHTRRMDKLLNSLLKTVEIGLQEAEKDLAQISKGEKPCRPSVLRQRLNDFLWDTQ